MESQVDWGKNGGRGGILEGSSFEGLVPLAVCSQAGFFSAGNFWEVVAAQEVMHFCTVVSYACYAGVQLVRFFEKYWAARGDGAEVRRTWHKCTL